MSIMSLDRSIELVSSVEEYFYKRIKCIFMQKNRNKDTLANPKDTLANLAGTANPTAASDQQQQPQCIQVTEAHIELLDEV